MSTPSLKHILFAGLAGGAVLNLIDTPWSVLVMVPKMQVFLDRHQLSSNAFAGPWFLATHFAFMILIAWVYALARQRFHPGLVLALAVAGVFLLINRAFGVGNVLIGIFAGFSIGMTFGTLAGGVAAAKVIDRSYLQPKAM
jgi:hypothetical protein